LHTVNVRKLHGIEYRVATGRIIQLKTNG